MLCMATPHTAKATPQTIAASILGSLSSMTTCAASTFDWGMFMSSSHRMP